MKKTNWAIFLKQMVLSIQEQGSFYSYLLSINKVSGFREPINEKFIYPNLNIKQAIESFLNEWIFAFFIYFIFWYFLLFYQGIHGLLNSKAKKIICP